MFDINKFSIILKNIKEKYSNQEEFAKMSGVGRTYISQYMNKKINTPPKPQLLEKIANASKGITTYDELMQICGYTNYIYDWFFDGAVHQRGNNIPIICDIKYNKEKNNFSVFSGSDYITANFELENNKEYFAYKIENDDMLPLVGIGDIAIIEKSDKFNNGNTCLISIDTNTIFIRKIIDFKDYIELHTAIPYSQPIKITNEEIKTRNFKILGKVIRVENSSAFK